MPKIGQPENGMRIGRSHLPEPVHVGTGAVQKSGRDDDETGPLPKTTFLYGMARFKP